MEIEFTTKFQKSFIFRELKSTDNIQLSHFFDQLSNDTKSKYGPHPLTRDEAFNLCNKIGKDNTKKFVVENDEEIVGYFILDFNPFENERQRYKYYGVEIDPRVDPVFAPCISDAYQNQGIASMAMNLILEYSQKQNIRSIILMGGTQEPNILAISYYKKIGFEVYGKFFTEHNNLYNIDMKLDL